MRVALLLKLSLLIELGLECALGWWLTGLIGWPRWTLLLLVPFVFALWRFVFFIVEFWLAQRLGEHVPREHRLSLSAWLRTVAEEWRLSVLTFSWLQPFAALAAPWALASPPHARTTRPVVLLVHGLLCNAAVWRGFKPVLERDGFDVELVNLPSVYGAIEGYIDPLHEAIESICQRRGVEKVFVVAHSMGGLVTRRYIAKHGDARLMHVVTLGTPHFGTRMADFGHGANVRDMRLKSDFLCGLHDACAHRVNDDFTCIYTWQDNLVVPQRHAVLPGAREIGYSGVGHLALVFNQRVQRDVIEILRQRAAHQCAPK